MKRYALITGARDEKEVAAYLPSGYEVLGTYWPAGQIRASVIIGGRDNAGWTLEAYVRPRLASGLMGCEEIDLSHPAMKTVEVKR